MLSKLKCRLYISHFIESCGWEKSVLDVATQHAVLSNEVEYLT